MPMTRPGVGHVPIPHGHPHRCAIHRHLSVETAIAAHRGGADAGAWDELPVGPVVEHSSRCVPGFISQVLAASTLCCSRPICVNALDFGASCGKVRHFAFSTLWRCCSAASTCRIRSRLWDCPGWTCCAEAIGPSTNVKTSRLMGQELILGRTGSSA